MDEDPPVISLDGGPRDLNPVPVCDNIAPTAIGGSCSVTDECATPGGEGSGMLAFCLDGVAAAPAWPGEGFCTAFFCSVDSDCGEGNVCGGLPDGFGGTFTACMPACCDGVEPGMSCSAGRICSDKLFGDSLGVEACVPGTAGRVDGAPCDEFADCAANSVCRRDAFQYPGGQCATVNCREDADCASGGDGRCVDVNGSSVCVDSCESDSDCRSADGYRCMDRGDGAGQHCQRPQPGDACDSDSDCGSGPFDRWSCRQGNGYPGGYCTVASCDPGDGDTCPVASFCVGVAGESETFCGDQCETAGSDECGTGYDCVEVFPQATAGAARNVCIPAGGTVDVQ